ncbi:class 1 fructose-bisphosphatase [Bermanella sp. R86510]|uniref:class 1 fructose-bisphosphatase n=1 Tax=unclassified Bermanella TaxID=2627862 RepID=UPI0037CB483D
MQTVQQILEKNHTSASLAQAIHCVLESSKEISKLLQKGAMAGVLGCAGNENVQGETQKKLDVISNDLLKDNLSKCPVVAGIASEEEDLPVAANDDGQYLVIYDPLDGSSNIDINVTVGTIFSILPSQGKDTSEEATYLQSGRKQLAAGYVLYGPATMLVMTTGHGVDIFTLDPDKNEFVLTQEQATITPSTKEFAINMSNQRFWAKPVQNYVSDLLQGEEGPLGKRYNMRWIAAMVAEVHRIINRGGIFMYPWDSREPSKPGKLRLMYEGNPMAMLVEQAGGLAVDGDINILDIEPSQIHQRVPVFLGSKEEVSTALGYHK